MDPNKSYVEVIHNLESGRVNKSMDNITRDGQYWYWCPKHKMERIFDGMYINSPSNKHDEWSELKQSNRELQKWQVTQNKGCLNSTGNNGSGKILTLS